MPAAKIQSLTLESKLIQANTDLSIIGMHKLKLRINSDVDLSQIVPACVKNLKIKMFFIEEEDFLKNSKKINHTLSRLSVYA